jgi:hypothetical protein
MRVRIECIREERQIPAGWFARETIAAWCLYVTVRFGEEEQFLLNHLGLGKGVFFQTPIPPDVTDPEEIERMEKEQYGLIRVGDLLDYRERKLLGVWPDAVAASGAEAELRTAFDILADQLKRGTRASASSVEFEP